MPETIDREIVNTEIGELFKIRAKRVASGVELYLQSEPFEEFFRSQAPESEPYFSSSNPGWAGHKMYKMASESATLPQHMRIWGSPLFVDGLPNLSFWRAKGLGEGLTFKIPGVYSRAILDSYVQYCEACASKFYKNFLHPYDREVSITVKGANREENS